MSGVVLITSSTGRIGKQLIARLKSNKNHSFKIRAAVHSNAPSDAGIETVKFDLKDSSTWDAALKDVSVIYSASLDPLLEHHLNFSKYLAGKKDQIKHVVRVSCMGADEITASYDANTHVTRPGAAIPLMLQHYWWGERSLINAGLNVTVLRANFFMNHLLKTDSDNIQNEGFFSNPLGNARNSFVATADIAEAAEVCIVEGPERHANKFYDLTGAAPQSMAEIAADLSEVMGKKVEYRPQSFEQFEKDFGPTRAAFFEYLTNGFYTRCSPDFYNLTGHKPFAYKDYLKATLPTGETGLDELWQGNLWKKGQDAMADAAKVKN